MLNRAVEAGCSKAPSGSAPATRMECAIPDLENPSTSFEWQPPQGCPTIEAGKRTATNDRQIRKREHSRIQRPRLPAVCLCPSSDLNIQARLRRQRGNCLSAWRKPFILLERSLAVSDVAPRSTTDRFPH